MADGDRIADMSGKLDNRIADMPGNKVNQADVYPDDDAIASAVARAIGEDLGVRGDVTTGLIPDGLTLSAKFVARSAGVFAGSRCATESFRRVEEIFARVNIAFEPLEIVWFHQDGDRIEAAEPLGQVKGTLKTILVGERTALNFLCHLSGVATATRDLVDIVKAIAPDCNVRDTRKTTPGLRVLEKAAVRAGGGLNHRMDLSEAILVKDNHLTGISIFDAVEKARQKWPHIPIEVECDTEAQVAESIRTCAPLILLDNMTPDQVKYCTKIAHDAGVKVEVSGGITKNNISQYASTGVDFISVGSITHSAQILDIGLDVQN